MILKVQNNLDQQALYSYSSVNILSGGTLAPVKNINAFTAEHAVQIGKTGEEQAEIVLISSGAPSGTALNLAGTLRFDHAIDTPIYDVNYNQIIFKRSTDGTVGTATAIATVSITPDSQYTEYDDAGGVSTYAYQTRFRNSATGSESSDSDWFIPGGPTFYSKAKMRQRIKDRLYNSEYIKSDDVIDDWINEWMEEMNNAAVKVNSGYLLGTTTIAIGTSGLGTITASDFMYPEKIEVTTDGTNYTQTTKTTMTRYDDNTNFSASYPYHSWQGDNLIQFLPKTIGGTARIVYSKGQAILDSETDELPYPMRRYTRGFVEYGLYCAYDNDEKADTSDRHYGKAQKIKADFINEITPRDRTGIQLMNMDEPITGFTSDGEEYL
jgi:hypothetical protein